MSFQLTTTDSEIKYYIEEEIRKKKNEIIQRLAYLGEQCVTIAKRKISSAGLTYYKDRTANLKSSIGYVILIDGVIVLNGKFRQEPQVDNKGAKADGAEKGQEFAKKIAAKYPKGIVLLIVAGMNYAEAVMARDYDVLDSAELNAENKMEGILKKLGFK